MKKLLALVLALVMTLGLATVGANAAYKDADSINYDEAVDVMTAIGVLAGDETGFRPADTLKRSEGAKIIAYLIAGQATADAMTATGTKYTDLPANHWAAGYMEYLSAIGVMGGLGDGRIDPDGSLSATAFAKMLLVALGYDATIEKMGGADWQINTQRLANKVGLFDGNSKVVGSAAVTREEAALYALNTLKAPVVEYETKGTSINVGDASITTGASNATYMTTTDSSARYRNIDNARVNGNGAQIVEFAEQYYDGLKLADGGTDAFGRPANVWTLKGKEVGTYTKGSDLQYTAAVKMGKIYTDLGLTSAIEPADITIKEDGVLATDANNKAGDDHSEWRKLRLVKGSTAEIGGNGALTEVYFDDDDKTVEIFVTNTYFAKVEAAYAATSTKDAYVVLNSTDNTGSGKTYNTADFKAGDYVLYTYSYDSNGIKSMELANAVQGTLSAYQVKTNVTVDGTTIKSNVVAASKESINAGLQNAINTSVTVFKDKYDYAVYVDASAASDAYAVIIGWSGANAVGTNSNDVVKLILADGTKKSVTISGITDNKTFENTDNSGAKSATDVDANLNVGDIVSYTVNSKGEYKLTLISDVATYTGANDVKLIEKNKSTANNNSAAATNGTDAVTSKGVYVGAAGTATKKTLANGKTTFVLYDYSKDTVNVYTGIANVPDIAFAGGYKINVSAWQKDTSSALNLVYIDVNGAAVSNASKDVIFVKGGNAGSKYDAAYGTYYEYNAIINDEVTKIKTEGKVSAYSMFTDMPKNADGVYDQTSYTDMVAKDTSAQEDDTVFFTTGTGAISNGTIRFGKGTTAYPYTYVPVASNVKVFNMNTDGELSASAVNTIQADNDDLVFWKLTDDEATTIIFVTVDDTETKSNGGVTSSDYALSDEVEPEYSALTNTLTIPYHYTDSLTPAEIMAIGEDVIGETMTRYNASSKKLFDANGDQYIVTLTPYASVSIGGTVVAWYEKDSDIKGNAIGSDLIENQLYLWSDKLHATAATNVGAGTGADGQKAGADGKITITTSNGTFPIGEDLDLIPAQTLTSAGGLTVTYPKTSGGTQTVTDNYVIQKDVVLTITGAIDGKFSTLTINGDEGDVVSGVDARNSTTYTVAADDMTFAETAYYDVQIDGVSQGYYKAGDATFTGAYNDANYTLEQNINKGKATHNVQTIDSADYVGTTSVFAYTVADTDDVNGVINLVQTVKVVASGLTVTYSYQGDFGTGKTSNYEEGDATANGAQYVVGAIVKVVGAQTGAAGTYWLKAVTTGEDDGTFAKAGDGDTNLTAAHGFSEAADETTSAAATVKYTAQDTHESVTFTEVNT